MTSIINPKDFPGTQVVPTTKLFFKKYPIAVELNCNFSKGSLDHYHSVRDLSIEDLEAAIEVKKTEEWIDTHLNHLARTQPRQGVWNYKTRKTCGTGISVFLKSVEDLRLLLENTGLEVGKIRAPTLDTHLEQIAQAEEKESVELRKQYYWKKYNYKLLINDRDVHPTDHLCKDVQAAFEDVKIHSYNGWSRSYVTCIYVNVPDDDALADLSLIKMQHHEKLEKILKVVLLHESP